MGNVIKQNDLNAYLNKDGISQDAYAAYLEGGSKRTKRRTPKRTKYFQNTSPIDYGRDISNTDYLPSNYSYFSPHDADELRATSQPWSHKAGRGLARVGVKVGQEVAKMPGVVGGIVAGSFMQLGDLASGEDNTDFMQVAFNNGWVQAVNKAAEHINTEALPVYVRDAVTSGTLMDKITSIDFWATEGADGLGYVISMLAPGLAVSKFSLGSKLFGVAKAARLSKSTEKAVGVFGKIGLTNANADTFLAGLANTVFEAGAEGQGAMEAFKQSERYANLVADLPNRQEAITLQLIADYQKQLQSGNGDVSAPQPDFAAQAEKMAKKEISDEVAKVGGNVFGANALILLGPNMVMSRMLYGGARKAAVETVFKDNIAQKATNTIFQKIGQAASGVAKGTISEGLWEEGMQSATEQYFTEHGGDRDLGDFLGGDFVDAYTKMVSTSSGQSAMFLGAFFGGGMYAYSNVKQKGKEVATHNKLMESHTNTLASLASIFSNEDIYKKVDGKFIYEENPNTGKKERVVDPIKYQEKVRGNFRLEMLKTLFDKAVDENDTDLIERITDELLNLTLKDFALDKNVGTKAIKDYLGNLEGIDNLAENAKMTKEAFIADLVKKTEYMSQKFENFKDFAPKLIKLNNEDATAEDKEHFLNRLSLEYVGDHANKYYLEKVIKRKTKALDDVLAEKGKTRADYENNALLRKELAKDKRVTSLLDSLATLEKDLENTQEKLEAYWDPKNAEEKFNAQVAKRKKLEEEDALKASAVLNDIASARTEEELANIDDMQDSAAASEIAKAKKKKEKEIKTRKKKETDEAEDTSAETTEEEEANSVANSEEAEFVMDNFHVGEVYHDYGEITEVTTKGVKFRKEDGTESFLSSEDLYKNRTSTKNNYSTEGDIDTNHKGEVVEVTDTDNTSMLEKSTDTQVLTKNANGVQDDFIKSFIDPEVINTEREEVDKTGNEVGFAINNGERGKLSPEQLQALDMYNKKDWSNIDFLIKHLPLNVKLGATVAPIRTYSTAQGGGKLNKWFDATTKHLRTVIINELAYNNANMVDITTTIAGQKGGKLVIAPLIDGEIVENSLQDLHQFDHQIKNIKSTDIYMVNGKGILVNTDSAGNSKTMRVKRNLKRSKGEIYLKVKLANGRSFPLKLNIRKINKDEAEVLYELYKHRIDDVGKGKAEKLITALPTDAMEKVADLFGKQLTVINKGKDATIKDVVDFLIFDGTVNAKSQVRFYTPKSSGVTVLKVAGEAYTAEQLKSEEGKAHFINILTTVKRHQISVKQYGKTSYPSIQTSRAYVEYLIGEKVLSTNASTEGHTFEGDTSIYLKSDNVKVNGKNSEYNSNVPKAYNSNLHGTNEQLEAELPGLFEKDLEVTDDSQHYVEKGKPASEKYNRVSKLKESGDISGANVENAATRGNVTDELARAFFGSVLKLDTFIALGKRALLDNNKKAGTKVTITDSFYEELFDIYTDYKNWFNSNNFTIYPTTRPLHGNLGELYAGSMDFLAKNNNTGEWIIIDLKTTTKDRSDYYDNPSPFVDYKKGDEIQQNAYRELFELQTGKKVSEIWIMPLTSTSKSANNEHYNTIRQDANVRFLKIDMSKNIYELKPKMAHKVDKLTKEELEDEAFNFEGFGPMDTSAFDKKKSKEDNTKKKTEPKPAAKEVVKENGTVMPVGPEIYTSLTAAAKADRIAGLTYKGKDGVTRLGGVAVDYGIIYLVDKKEPGKPIIVTDLAEFVDIMNKGSIGLVNSKFTTKEGKEAIQGLDIDKAAFMKKVKERMGKEETPVVKAKKATEKVITELKKNSAPASSINIRLSEIKHFIKSKRSMLKDFSRLLGETKDKSAEEQLKIYLTFLASKNIAEADITKNCK